MNLYKVSIIVDEDLLDINIMADDESSAMMLANAQYPDGDILFVSTQLEGQ